MSSNVQPCDEPDYREKLREIIIKRRATANRNKEVIVPKCTKKWVDIPDDKTGLYDITQVVKCRTCFAKRSMTVYAVPFIVHDEAGDDSCFKCKSSCYVTHMCPQCNGSLNKQLQRNNRDARNY